MPRENLLVNVSVDKMVLACPTCKAQGCRSDTAAIGRLVLGRRWQMTCSIGHKFEVLVGLSQIERFDDLCVKCSQVTAIVPGAWCEQCCRAWEERMANQPRISPGVQ